MQNITYLLGAGASANAIPVVKNLSGSMKDIAEMMDELDIQFSETDFHKEIPTVSKRGIQQEFSSDLLNLIQKIGSTSFDAYLRKLHIHDDESSWRESQKLKNVFGTYLSILELLKEEIRYDGFWSNIITSSPFKLPQNIKILSWNYDQQLELSFSKFSKNDDIHVNSNYIGQLEKGIDRRALYPVDQFRVFKLNGSASLKEFGEHGSKYYYNNYIGNKKEQLGTILKSYYFVKHDLVKSRSAISFAWEKKSRHNEEYDDIIEVASNAIRGTNILVIVGYSFPDYNSVIDQLLLNKMQSLKKVYFEDIYPEDIKEKFLDYRSNIPNDNLITKKAKDSSYYIPKEFFNTQEAFTPPLIR